MCIMLQYLLNQILIKIKITTTEKAKSYFFREMFV